MGVEFNITPSAEERKKFYLMLACSEAAVPQICQNCGAGFTARGTYFSYQPNEAGRLTGRQPFTELMIATNCCENCR